MKHLFPTVLLFLFAGCGGGARVVVRDETGGLLSLSGDLGAARQEASRIIEAHCPQGHRVTLDEEVLVREDEHTTARQGEALALDQSRQTSGGIEPGSQTSLTFSETGSVQTFDPNRQAAPRETQMHHEHRLEYECSAPD